MKFNLLGKTGLSESEARDILYNEPMKISDREALAEYMTVQRKIDAERRMKKEKDPQRKREMQMMLSRGYVNFDRIFGKE